MGNPERHPSAENPPRHPSPARLIETADAADALATALPKYWPFPDAPPGCNPARLRFPRSPDLEDPEFWERADDLWLQVAEPWVALANCLIGVSAGDWLEGLNECTRKRLGLPQKAPSQTSIVGWSYDVKVALAMLREVVCVVGTAIGVLGVKRDFKRIAYREVERLQDAAKMLRQLAAVREAAGSTPPEEPAGSGNVESWSQPDSPQRWAKTFNVSSDTIKRHFKDGTIRNKKLSDRSYQVHVDDLPKAP